MSSSSSSQKIEEGLEEKQFDQWFSVKESLLKIKSMETMAEKLHEKQEILTAALSETVELNVELQEMLRNTKMIMKDFLESVERENVQVSDKESEECQRQFLASINNALKAKFQSGDQLSVNNSNRIVKGEEKNRKKDETQEDEIINESIASEKFGSDVDATDKDESQVKEEKESSEVVEDDEISYDEEKEEELVETLNIEKDEDENIQSEDEDSQGEDVNTQEDENIESDDGSIQREDENMQWQEKGRKNKESKSVGWSELFKKLTKLGRIGRQPTTCTDLDEFPTNFSNSVNDEQHNISPQESSNEKRFSNYEVVPVEEESKNNVNSIEVESKKCCGSSDFSVISEENDLKTVKMASGIESGFFNSTRATATAMAFDAMKLGAFVNANETLSSEESSTLCNSSAIDASFFDSLKVGGFRGSFSQNVNQFQYPVAEVDLFKLQSVRMGKSTPLISTRNCELEMSKSNLVSLSKTKLSNGVGVENTCTSTLGFSNFDSLLVDISDGCSSFAQNINPYDYPVEETEADESYKLQTIAAVGKKNFESVKSEACCNENEKSALTELSKTCSTVDGWNFDLATPSTFSVGTVQSETQQQFENPNTFRYATKKSM